MYSFQTIETFLDAPLNMVSGIDDLLLTVQGGTVMLYSITRAGGGVLALEIDAGMTQVGMISLAATTILPAPGTLDLMPFAGQTVLVTSGANQARTLTYRLETDGTFDRWIRPIGSLAGVISAETWVQTGGQTYFYGARANDGSIHAFSCGQDGTMTLLQELEAGPDLQGIDIRKMTAVSIGGQPYVIALSLAGDRVTSYAVGADGRLTEAGRIGAAAGLGMSDPTAVAAIESGGRSFLVVASASSSSLSVLEIAANGRLSVTDHVIDTLDTRFAGVSAVAAVNLGDRAFVVAGGGDGGLHLFALLPDGRLVLTATLLDTPELALEAITALEARVVNGQIEVFVAGEGTGISRLRLDPGALAPTLAGTAGADSLTGGAAGDLILGGAGNDVLAGEAGADILVDGAGSDTLSGGAGADVFVLDADGATDRIADFQVGIDRIDLSSWGRVHDAADLTITPTATGCTVGWRGEVLEIFSSNGLPILAATLARTTLFPLWHEPPARTNADGRFIGTEAADLIYGTAGDDVFLASPGSDTIDGGEGRDLVDFSALSVGLSVSLSEAQAVPMAVEATGQPVYVAIEDLAGTRFADTLTGNAVNNLLLGNDGADMLLGLAGNDQLFGGEGNDTLRGGAGADRLDGGNGKDFATYSDASAGLRADLSSPGTNTGDAAGDTFLAVENLAGSQFADVLIGDAGANVITGNGGADVIEGRGGDDQLLGGAGADVFVFNGGRDLVLDFETDIDAIRLDPGLWGGGARSIADVLAPENVILGAGSVTLVFSAEDRLEIRGITDPILLFDDLLFG
ncbi:M10 family metallopeptidase C-terminal domain-containing protein [Rhodobacter sp. Har01]|uniref:calcium-binding protein n=1 Tax=Rhodobacter sp. Har01 TaxID=2883999 RepID=UPI001D08320D|nr:calcium-binding protein [Rhodobacter sp. Har01]MCB6178383.1 M10 family metallopeptidase C-terminal domain-containing protein [Rhodobacter sp. Har01]